MSEIPHAVWEQIDRALKVRNEFTREAIEEELGKIYQVGGDIPTVDDDDFHYMISEIWAEYLRRGLAQE